MPHDTPQSFFHAAAADGGLGVVCLATAVPLWRWRRLEQLKKSSHPSAPQLVSSSYFETVVQRASRLGLPAVKSKEKLREVWREKLYRSVDGAGLSAHQKGPRVLDWVRTGRYLRGAAYVRATHVLGNLLPTASRCHRGRSDRTLCEAGCRRAETLGHISQVCPRTHGPRVGRHDKLVNYAAGRLTELGFRVEVEPAIPTPEGVRRPDIVAMNGRASQAVVIDAQVVADHADLDAAHRRKVKHYDTDAIKSFVAERSGLRDRDVVVTSVTLNWRGAFSSLSADDIRRLGFTPKDLRRLSTDTLLGTAACWSVFNRGTSRASQSSRRRRRPASRQAPL